MFMLGYDVNRLHSTYTICACVCIFYTSKHNVLDNALELLASVVESGGCFI